MLNIDAMSMFNIQPPPTPFNHLTAITAVSTSPPPFDDHQHHPSTTVTTTTTNTTISLLPPVNHRREPYHVLTQGKYPEPLFLTTTLTKPPSFPSLSLSLPVVPTCPLWHQPVPSLNHPLPSGTHLSPSGTFFPLCPWNVNKCVFSHVRAPPIHSMTHCSCVHAPFYSLVHFSYVRALLSTLRHIFCMFGPLLSHYPLQLYPSLSLATPHI